jgi:hypothetical protein
VPVELNPQVAAQLKGSDKVDRISDNNRVDIKFPDKKDKNPGLVHIYGPKKDAERAREDLLRAADQQVSCADICTLVRSILSVLSHA